MPQRKITDDIWEKMYADYKAWDPAVPGALSADELVAKYGVAKQTFYTELKRRGIPLKRATTTTEETETLKAVLELLVAARIRIKVLEQALEQAGVQVP